MCSAEASREPEKNMISKLKTEEINDILDIWLKASIKAHGFVAEDFWKSKIDAMRTIYIPYSETYVLKFRSNPSTLFSDEIFYDINKMKK